MSRPLNLDCPDDSPIQEGDWVHTTEPVILAWFGLDERNMRSMTNSHRVEGKAIFMRGEKASSIWIETNLPPKHHELKVHANRRAIPVYAENVPLDICRKGPLPDAPPRMFDQRRPARAIQL